ncbi:related to vacuolar sorting protein VPS1, dynamin, and related proteins [Rhynchosporium agropyri]|uniref:Related to vacuolar sorting protein VPS1, dynamin, and related proteins n=1 Tax=Rhynchosporium agropyri TaxID=914238 RepID=A0A1E1K338_9HELO|nr:related to vacuolar sorting protein VPS1, dynamin, and related proteins [Rhynchosporium agropyri]
MLAEDATRLQKIDELYALRLDQYVSLPQLVVVGDQSSGKSSVLEGLTNLPFPRDSGLCTRFPTQIVFKRSVTSRKEVSIMAAHGQEQSKTDAIAMFGKIQLTSFDENSFSNLLAKASECMGLPYPGKQRDDNMDSFSHNILKFELSGPEYENFSVVDLPGLFRKPTPGQTSKEDMALVRGIVAKYLGNPRSIILAVVPANIDIATQEIIQMAEDADPDGQRTLGVLTKPDIVIELVMNQAGNARFELGYTIVCNRSQSDLGITNDERNAREAIFFKREPWSAIPEERAGVKSLKDRLNNLLVDVTRHNFQAVAEDLRLRIHNLEGELDDMGPGRHTPNDQRNHLIRIATDVREITSKAIDAYYGRDQCFEDNTFRLATNVMTMNKSFSDAIARKGCTRRFRSEATENDTIAATSETGEAGYDSCASSTDGLGTLSTPKAGTETQSLHEYPELKVLMGPPEPAPATPKQDIMQWITKQYERSKGFEIGTLNPSLLPSLFSEQSQSWKYFASGHVENVVQAIHHFTYKTLQHCCKDAALSKRLWGKLSQLLLPKYRKALDQAIFLVKVEQQGNLLTMNHYFADNLRKAREDRIKKQLINLQSWTTDDPLKQPLLRLEDTITTFLSNEDQTTQDLHDTLEAYYKVSRKRFVDAVCLQAVDHFLISSKDGPLWLFSPQLIGRLTDSELSRIAGESDQTVVRRARLTEEITNLRAGQKILED